MKHINILIITREVAKQQVPALSYEACWIQCVKWINHHWWLLIEIGIVRKRAKPKFIVKTQISKLKEVNRPAFVVVPRISKLKDIKLKIWWTMSVTVMLYPSKSINPNDYKWQYSICMCYVCLPGTIILNSLESMIEIFFRLNVVHEFPRWWLMSFLHLCAL